MTMESTTNNSTPMIAFPARSLRSPPHQTQAEPTYYTMLNVPQDADDNTIETAFKSKLMSRRNIILTYDKQADDHLLDYPGIAELYRAVHVLKDPIRRSLYDRGRAGGREGYVQVHAGARRPGELLDSWRPERDGRDWPIPRPRSPSV